VEHFVSTDTNIWVKEPDATGTLRAVQRDVVWTLHTVRAAAGSCQATQAACVGCMWGKQNKYHAGGRLFHPDRGERAISRHLCGGGGGLRFTYMSRLFLSRNIEDGNGGAPGTAMLGQRRSGCQYSGVIQFDGQLVPVPIRGAGTPRTCHNATLLCAGWRLDSLTAACVLRRACMQELPDQLGWTDAQRPDPGCMPCNANSPRFYR
jgi:hypothetical protein